MNVQETDFPEKFRPIIRRLQAAVQEKEVRDIMTVEDDFIAELNDYEHRIAEALQKQEEALQKQAEEKQQKEQERAQKMKAVALLLNLGVSKAKIAEQLGLSLDELDE